MDENKTSKQAPSIAKAAAFLVSLLFGIAVIVFNVYMYGVFHQTSAQLSEHQQRMDLLVKSTDAMKEEAANLRRENSSQDDLLSSQKDLLRETRDNIDKLNERLDQLQETQRQELSRLAQEQSVIKQGLADITPLQKDVEALKAQNKEWQRDYVTVLKNLDDITKKLDEKLKSTRADFIGRMGELETRLNRVSKDIENQDNGVKPSIIHKRLSNDSAGLLDVLDAAQPAQKH